MEMGAVPAVEQHSDFVRLRAVDEQWTTLIRP
jgi:hypothetical protein